MTLARVPDFDYRINPATCDLDLARETRKRRGKRTDGTTIRSFSLVPSEIFRENSASPNGERRKITSLPFFSITLTVLPESLVNVINVLILISNYLTTGTTINLAVNCGDF